MPLQLPEFEFRCCVFLDGVVVVVLSFNPLILARLGKRPTFADDYLKETFPDFASV